MRSKVALERFLLAWVFGWQDFYLSGLKPNVEAWVHAASNVRESNSLVNSILEEGYSAVASIVRNAKPSGCLFTFASVAEDRARLEALIVNTYQFERPHVPVDARGRVFPES